MDRTGFLYTEFLRRFSYEPTPCQDRLMQDIASFATGDDADILVVNGYAGTGKTTALAAVVSTFSEFKTPCVLMAPTGRAAKVLSNYTGRPASTVHKQIYRQKSHGDDGFGQFSLAPNKAKNTLFIVDEVSLIGIEAGERQSTTVFGSGNLLEDLITFQEAGMLFSVDADDISGCEELSVIVEFGPFILRKTPGACTANTWRILPEGLIL